MEIKGKVICRKIRFPKSVARLIEKHLRNRLPKLDSSGKSATYSVMLEREESGEMVNCQIEIRVGTRVWRGRDFARDIHHALLRSLSNLAPVPYLVPVPT